MSKIKDFIRSITKKSDDYDEKYMKIKFNLDDELPLNKTIELPNMIIVLRSAFHENNIKIPYYDRVDISERSDVNKTSESK